MSEKRKRMIAAVICALPLIIGVFAGINNLSNLFSLGLKEFIYSSIYLFSWIFMLLEAINLGSRRLIKYYKIFWILVLISIAFAVLLGILDYDIYDLTSNALGLVILVFLAILNSPQLGMGYGFAVGYGAGIPICMIVIGYIFPISSQGNKNVKISERHNELHKDVKK